MILAGGLQTLYARVRVWLRQRSCDHAFRPALTSRGGAQWCQRCGLTQPLTEAAFYALYGRMPYL